MFCSGPAALAQAQNCQFRADAPDQHAVVKGDTLWEIAGRFLEKPWCWPTVWGLNREQIRDPHWIYPGQLIWFDRAAGRLRLGGPGAAADGADAPATLRLAPRARAQGLEQGALDAIPAAAIEPFLSQPLLIENDELAGAPRVVATEEGRVFLGNNDKAYVRGDLKGGTTFQVFRPGVALKDPLSKAVLAYEAFYLGTLQLRSAAKGGPGQDVHTFVVASAKQEMGKGDLLLPMPPIPLQHYMPHPPERPVAARVVAIYGGVTYAGQNQVISINRGKLDGLDVGAVLQLYHAGATVSDPGASKGWLGMGQPQVKLPDEEMGSLFIFRVFQHIAYGLIMQVRGPVQVGDVAQSPE